MVDGGTQAGRLSDNLILNIGDIDMRYILNFHPLAESYNLKFFLQRDVHGRRGYEEGGGQAVPPFDNGLIAR